MTSFLLNRRYFSKTILLVFSTVVEAQTACRFSISLRGKQIKRKHKKYKKSLKRAVHQLNEVKSPKCLCFVSVAGGGEGGRGGAHRELVRARELTYQTKKNYFVFFLL